MKIKITMKDPDGFSECFEEAVRESVKADAPGMSEDDREAVVERRKERAYDDLKRWVEYGEYITVEFDTDEMTARVIEVR